MINEFAEHYTPYQIPAHITGDYRILKIDTTHEQEKYLNSKGLVVGKVRQIHEYNFRMSKFFQEYEKKLFGNDESAFANILIVNLLFHESTFFSFEQVSVLRW